LGSAARITSASNLHPLFDDDGAWGDEDSFVWIGVHFGSRGLGRTSATEPWQGGAHD
jgi:RNA-splicing ligase RtcB